MLKIKILLIIFSLMDFFENLCYNKNNSFKNSFKQACQTENNAKVPFPLMSPADFIARAKFSSLSFRNVHGHKNLLSFFAIRIREA